MTNQYLRNTTADYITGAVSALKGVKNTVVLINGPSGCKTYYGFETGQSFIDAQRIGGLQGQMRLKGAIDSTLLRSQYYMGFTHIPSTNLRYEDFIYGTVDQLKKALNDIAASSSPSLIAVINAPGTSLLSEEIEPELKLIAGEKGIPYVYIESPGLSENMHKGYDETIVKIVESVAGDGIRKSSAVKARSSVNLFGLGSRDIYVDGDLEEITRLLSLCDIDVNCAPGAFCSVQQLKSLGNADANIFLASEKCGKTASYIAGASDIPVFDFGCLPIGPDLTEAFVKGISELLGTDCSKALEEIEKTRAKIFYHVARRTGGMGFPKDIKYAAEGEASLVFALADFLTGYMGMIPDAVHVMYRQDESFAERSDIRGNTESFAEEKLLNLLESCGCEKCLEKEISSVKDAVLFGSANTIAHVLAYSGNVYGVETMLPSSGYINVIPKTLTGCKGSLYILEQVLNAVRLLKAWD